MITAPQIFYSLKKKTFISLEAILQQKSIK